MTKSTKYSGIYEFNQFMKCLLHLTLFLICALLVLSCNSNHDIPKVKEDYPHTIVSKNLEDVYDDAKWSYYISNFNKILTIRSTEKDTILAPLCVKAVDCELDIGYLDMTKKDTIEIIFEAYYENEPYSTDDIYWCGFGYIEGRRNLSYRQPCHVFPVAEMDYFIAQELLPRNYEYKKDKHQWQIEEEAFIIYLKLYQKYIRNEWLLQQAKKRGILK